MPASASTNHHRYTRLRRGIGFIGLAGLVCLGLTYWLTHEPAPRVRVLWVDEVAPAQRASLERKYLLLNPRDQMSSGSLAYDLLDTSASNIQALVEDAAIADTNDIDRNTYVVPFDVEYGAEWMWLAHRTPVFRDLRVRAVVLAALALMVLGGLGIDARDAWRALTARVLRSRGRS